MASWNETSQEKIQFNVPLICTCGQVGFAVWEEFKSVSQSGLHTALIGLSDNFHERIQASDRMRIEVVCSACGAVQGS